MDNSAFYHRFMLEAHVTALWDKNKPWIFETDDAIHLCATESEARMMQREYRMANGFNSITGERAKVPA